MRSVRGCEHLGVVGKSFLRRPEGSEETSFSRGGAIANTLRRGIPGLCEGRGVWSLGGVRRRGVEER